MKRKEDKTFVEITNQDLWDLLNEMKTEVKKIQEQNIRIEGKCRETNGRLRMHDKAILVLGSAIGTMFITLVGWLLYFLK